MDTSPETASNQGLRIDMADIGSSNWAEVFEINKVNEVPGLEGGSYERTRLNQRTEGGDIDRRKRKGKANFDIGRFDFECGFADAMNDQACNDLYYVDKRFRVVFSNGSRTIASGWIATVKPMPGDGGGETLLHVIIECDGDEFAFKAATEGSLETD